MATFDEKVAKLREHTNPGDVIDHRWICKMIGADYVASLVAAGVLVLLNDQPGKYRVNLL